jgi:hypothetical protein
MKALFDNPRRALPPVIWAGIAINIVFFSIPLFFFPQPYFALLGIELTDRILARASGMLLFIISVFYIPAAWDVDRYRANAWFHCVPSRFCGATFFTVAVLFFGFPGGYLSIAIVDGVFLLLVLMLLLRITATERADGAPVRLR